MSDQGDPSPALWLGSSPMHRSPPWFVHLWFSIFNEKLQQRGFYLLSQFRNSVTTCSVLLWKRKLKIERLLSVFRERYKD